MAKAINRDDIDADTMAEMEKVFAELYPGFKVVCAGDTPGPLPPDIQEALDAINKANEQSLINGTCIDCGAAMPNYPPQGEEFTEDWRPAEGWRWFTEMGTEQPAAWQCPECDALEQEEDDQEGGTDGS